MRALLFAAAVLSAGLARAEVPASVRVGDHPGFGRIVFDFPEPTSFDLVERGNRLLVTFSGAATIGTPGTVPRNVLSLAGGQGSATVLLTPGARVRPSQAGNRVVIDVLDSPPTRARLPGPATTPRSAPAPILQEAAPAPQSPQQPPSIERVTSAPELAPAEAVAPLLVVTDAPLRLIAGAGIGAAAFRRGDLGVIVLDQRLDLDMGQVSGNRAFAAMSKQQVGDATILTVPLQPGQALSLVRDSKAWSVKLDSPPGPGIVQTSASEGVALKLDHPGRVVAVQDPVTGQVLLVGTSNQPAGPGPGNAVARAAPGYALLPTWLGVAVEPSSDRVDLRVSISGFTLVTPDAGDIVQVSAPAPSRRFDFPAAGLDVLVKRLDAQVAGAAAQPPRSRGPERVAAAQTMLALGMAAEAQAVLAVAMADDPAVANDADVLGLSAIAALLADRLSEVAGLDDPRLDGSDEIALWRGVRDVASGKQPENMASRIPLVLAYPVALRSKLLPIVAESAVLAGSLVALEALAPNDGLLAYARAIQLERGGETQAALSAYDGVAAGQNRSDAVRAATRAAELRLSTGQLTPGAAADVIERQTVAWRGDTRESKARLRVAELRTNAGSWRAALDWLRETEVLFPNLKPETGIRKAEVFKALLSGTGETLPALDLVSLAGDYADCLPEGYLGERLARMLADKLVALDLPSRAGPALRTLMEAAAPGSIRAEFGTRLAQVLLDSSEPAQAEAALGASSTPGLSAENVEARTLLLARARAGQGDVAGAAAELTALGSVKADELRALLLARSADWRGSLLALNDLAAKIISAEGDLSEDQQDIVLRQATAAAQAGDIDALRGLRRLHTRMKAPRLDLFRALTAQPVQTPADLPRAGRELALARAVSDRLQTLTRR